MAIPNFIGFGYLAYWLTLKIHRCCKHKMLQGRYRVKFPGNEVGAEMGIPMQLRNNGRKQKLLKSFFFILSYFSITTNTGFWRPPLIGLASPE
jgi:hypothetical protein